MSTTIEGGMRREINRAIDTGVEIGHRSAEWARVLQSILAEFRDEQDNFVIIIQAENYEVGPVFNNQMRLTLGWLRGISQ